MADVAKKVVFCIGTADTKLEELKFLADCIRSDLDSFSKASPIKVQVSVVDVSTGQNEITSLEDIPFVSRDAMLSCLLGTEGGSYKFPDDRGGAIAIMSNALTQFLNKAYEDNILVGAVGIGGSGETSLIAPALRSISSSWSINSVSRATVSNVGAAAAGMIVGKLLRCNASGEMNRSLNLQWA